MTREQTIEIMAVLRGAYPAFYRDMTKAEALDVINLWAELFADDEACLVGAAIKALIAADTKGYPPHIGAVKEQMRKLTTTGEHTEAEAWARILHAIRNSNYGSEEEFQRLPRILQKLVGSPAQLREWAVMDSDELHSVVASNIQRAYRTMQQREHETAKLPADVKQMIAELTAGRTMPPVLGDGNGLVS